MGFLQGFRSARAKAKTWLNPARPGGRQEFVVHLSGKGVELGALKDPLDLSMATRVQEVRYVDQHPKSELIRLFPELESVKEQIVEPDITCNISEGLQPFAADTLDFVVANHLIEHLPDPIFFLREVWRVLKPGGKLYLGVPDREFNFDRDRPLTRVLHLIHDYLRRVKTVEDHHLAEFLAMCDKVPLPEDPQKRAEVLESHRQRSVHVHVWDVHTFCRFLLGLLTLGPWPFRVLDLSTPRDNLGGEIIFILEKTSPFDLRRFVRDPMPRVMWLALPGVLRRYVSTATLAS